MLVTLLGVSALNVYLSIQRTRSQIESQLSDVARTIAEATFPLTDNVLRQMRDLSGAELLLVSSEGNRLAGSKPADESGSPEIENPPADLIPSAAEFELGNVTQWKGDKYFHTALILPERQSSRSSRMLHMFYPEHRYAEALRDAILPPMVVGGVALLLVIVLAHWFASRLTDPIKRLQQQVQRIAQGEFVPMPLPQRNDELKDLAGAVNRMSELLAGYEDEVRRSEQLKTLGLLKGGIAHQLRNAVTGCRMALDLHCRELSEIDAKSNQQHDPADRESLEVAMRQLNLIEKQLQTFLTEQRAPAHRVETDLGKIVSDVLPLVSPAAQHLAVDLQWKQPVQPYLILADVSGMEQLLGNLLLNALDAASASQELRKVRVELQTEGSPVVKLNVWDTGEGPAEEIGNKLFEPMVTNKRGGTGLGLSVVRDIARSHGGDVSWKRQDGWTCFSVELPLVVEEDIRVETAGR